MAATSQRNQVNNELAGQIKRIEKDGGLDFNKFSKGEKDCLIHLDPKEKANVQRRIAELHNKRDALDKVDAENLKHKSGHLTAEEKEILKRVAKSGNRTVSAKLHDEEVADTHSLRESRQKAFSSQEKYYSSKEKYIDGLEKKAKKRFVDGKISLEELNTYRDAYQVMRDSLASERKSFSNEKALVARKEAVNDRNDSKLPDADKVALRDLQTTHKKNQEEIKALRGDLKKMGKIIKENGGTTIAEAAHEKVDSLMEKISDLRDQQAHLSKLAMNIRQQGASILNEHKSSSRQYSANNFEDSKTKLAV